MNSYIIQSRQSVQGGDPPVHLYLQVEAVVQTPTGTRSGCHLVELPETATDEEIKDYLLAAYGVPPEERVMYSRG
jgi:hypothetical protein